MKKTIVIAIALCSLLMTSCSKDAEVNAFITEFEATTKEITSKIDSNPTAAGVADAQKAFDAKKLASRQNGTPSRMPWECRLALTLKRNSKTASPKV